MRARAWLVALLWLPLGAVPSLGVEIVGVLRGDVLLARVGDRVIGLRLAGVWVPAPPGLGEEVQYRGAEARRFVIDAIDGQKLKIVRLGRVRPGRPLRVRILLGDEGERDLAVMLAEAGLALSVRHRAADPEHGEAIYRAERRARAARRGMHDGGHTKFEATVGRQQIFFALSGWLAEQPSDDLPRDDVGLGATAPGPDSWWEAQSSSEIHGSAVDAIRDYGESMGLAPDASRDGH